MITTLYIPVIDTEQGNYDYGRNISNEEYENSVMKHFLETTNDVNDLMYKGRKVYNPYVREIENEYIDKPILENYSECEVLILNAKKKEIDENYLFNYIENGKMFVIILNINPNSLDNNAESELRFWIDDSKRVHNDMTLPDEVKLKRLPTHTFEVKLNGQRYTLKNCKLVEDFSNNKFPFYFGIIVTNIN